MSLFSVYSMTLQLLISHSPKKITSNETRHLVDPKKLSSIFRRRIDNLIQFPTKRRRKKNNFYSYFKCKSTLLEKQSTGKHFIRKGNVGQNRFSKIKMAAQTFRKNILSSNYFYLKAKTHFLSYYCYFFYI